jgi:hypothetical protein
MLPTGKMPRVDFEIAFRDQGPPDVEIALSGVLDIADFHRLTATLTADPRFRAGLTLLVDLSALDTADLSADGVQDLSGPVVERDWYYPPAAVAIIATDAHTLGTARAYRAHLGGSRSNRHIFKSREDAVSWLGKQNRG